MRYLISISFKMAVMASRVTLLWIMVFMVINLANFGKFIALISNSFAPYLTVSRNVLPTGRCAWVVGWMSECMASHLAPVRWQESVCVCETGSGREMAAKQRIFSTSFLNYRVLLCFCFHCLCQCDFVHFKDVDVDVLLFIILLLHVHN